MGAARRAAPERGGVSLRLGGESLARAETVAVWLAAGFAVALALAVSHPYLAPLPGRDSGAYLYAGQQLLAGKRLYLDLWDHKGPLIHHINALAAVLGEDQVRALWWLRLLWLALTSVLAAALLTRRYPPRAALAGAAWAFAPLALLAEGGNTVEEYALLFSWVSLALLTAPGLRENLVRPLTLGVLIGASVALRPNLVATPMAVLFALLVQGQRRAATLLYFCLGVALVGGAWAWALDGFAGVAACLDAVWHYNRAYVAGGDPFALGKWWHAEGPARWLLAVAVGGWVVSVLGVLRKSWTDDSLRFAAILAFPCEVAAVSLSGRPYLHYLLALTPSGAVLVAAGVADLVRWTKYGSRAAAWGAAAGIAMVLYTAAVTVRAPFATLVRSVWGERWVESAPSWARAEELAQLAKQGGPLWVWGAESSALVLARRESPVRYYYAYPLLTRGYANLARVGEVKAELCRRRPEILEASAGNPVIPPIRAEARRSWRPGHPAYFVSTEVESLLKFVEAHWREKERLPNSGFVLWQPLPLVSHEVACQCAHLDGPAPRPNSPVAEADGTS